MLILPPSSHNQIQPWTPCHPRMLQAEADTATNIPFLAQTTALDHTLDMPHLGTAIRQGFESKMLPVSVTQTELRTLKDSGTMWARRTSSIASERFFDVTAVELAALTSRPGGYLT